MKPPKISVITPTFNSIRTLRETIESVLDQSYPHLEHIVVDGGSTDGTIELLRKYPHLTWISEKDEGLYHAMNKGILRATGEWIVVLNSDDCFRSKCLSKVAEAIQKNPSWSALFGDVVYVDSKGQEIYRREEAKYSYAVLRYWGNYINHQTVFVKKTAYDLLGLYRYEDFLRAADYEFLLRLGRARHSVGHVPSLLVNFRIHDFGQTTDLREMRNGCRETDIVRNEYGVSGGLGKILSIYGRALRQCHKLLYRGKCDLILGTWHRRHYMRERGYFSSNRSVTH